MSLRYFGNELYNRGPNKVIAFSWRDCAGFLFVGYWITHCVPCLGTMCSMSWMFSGFYWVPNCVINIWHHMLCYIPNIYNYITFTASLERVQFEYVQSFKVLLVLYFSDFVCKRSLNSFDGLYVYCFPWIPELATVL